MAIALPAPVSVICRHRPRRSVNWRGLVRVAGSGGNADLVKRLRRISVHRALAMNSKHVIAHEASGRAIWREVPRKRAELDSLPGVGARPRMSADTAFGDTIGSTRTSFASRIAPDSQWAPRCARWKTACCRSYRRNSARMRTIGSSCTAATSARRGARSALAARSRNSACTAKKPLRNGNIALSATVRDAGKLTADHFFGM